MDTMMSMAAPPVLQGSSGYYTWQRQLRIYVNGVNPMMWEEITGTACDGEGDGEGDGGGGDKAGGIGGNSVVSTRVSSALTNACSDPRTAVDYCLRFYLSGPLTCYGLPSDISVASDTAPALSLQRVPSSSSTVQGGPSSTTPVLLSCVDSFDTAPPPCLAPLCLLSGVDFFDTAPPPQDLLAGLLYTAPPPSTGDGSFGSYLSSP
ncbi:uncharacterized protein UDID_18332 [Ustilago sp. UG-2017a]|nr:uncharacterized protein UDID_18332 [Ustilago sp. UG-2017a]